MNFNQEIMKYTFLLFSLIIIFGSCRKKLDIDIPDTKKHIVLNGIINPDSIIRVRVTKSKGVLDNNNIENLSSAIVKIYKNNVYEEDLEYSDSGYFYSSVKPEINSDYKITADYAELQSVEAETRLTEPIEIQSIDTVIQIKITDWGGYIDTSYEIHTELKFEDNVSSSDFYALSVSTLIPNYDYSDTSVVFLGYDAYENDYDTSNPVLNKRNNEFFLDGMSGRVFNDELFNGNTYKLPFTIYYQNNNVIDKNISASSYPSKIVIRLMKVTEEIYNYVFSYNLNQQTNEDPFAQPVQVYSNVKNGLGIFSGYTMSTDTIVIDNL